MHVFVPVDGAPAAARAVQFVSNCALGRQQSIETTLVNVQCPPIGTWQEPGPASEALSRHMRAHGEALLEPPRAALTRAGFAVKSIVRLGAPAAALLEILQAEAASVAVMGTRGAGPLRGFAWGSVALRVASAAPCPVILVKPEARLPSSTRDVTRVLVPLDGSRVSDSAVERVLSLRELLGPLQIDLVHFEPALTLLEAIAPPHDDVLRNWSAEQSRHAVAAAAQRLHDAGVAHETLHLTGDAADGIAALAARRSTDLIAMATHGTGALHHATVGSVALKTVVLAGVPVMVTH
jgi:nucleotide-binding universal stress UspA family protein